ncbi:hypothetical protein OIU79_012512 [Salix purpurea]|uniref:Uncharacterized protein n=1 Tax=Salix purpurea TaxID=77065 RepID=A0A9Q0Q3B6_SALPP|nr:hypothetical protein OIU79_012512 [Salix purpurea]
MSTFYKDSNRMHARDANTRAANCLAKKSGRCLAGAKVMKLVYPSVTAETQLLISRLEFFRQLSTVVRTMAFDCRIVSAKDLYPMAAGRRRKYLNYHFHLFFKLLDEYQAG